MSDILQIINRLGMYDELRKEFPIPTLCHIQPCPYYADKNTPEEQMMHIMQEVGEAWQALGDTKNLEKDSDLAMDHLAEELVDIQSACETMLHIIGYGPLDRARMRGLVNKKNEHRGYWSRYEDGADEG